MERMGERIARKFDSPEWEEKMNNLGERISEKFESGEFEEKMERLGERLSEKFESEEWQEKMERMGDDISINFNGEELETSMESSIVDGEDFHIEGDINFNEKDWENFGDNLENTIESIMEGVDQALQGVGDNIADIGSEFVALEESMQSALKEDGFYKNGKVSLELEEGAIKINGKRQAIQMEDKYKKIILDAFSVDSEDAPYFQYKFSDKKGKVKNSFSIDNDKKRETKTVKRF